jgi:hypothetical protein
MEATSKLAYESDFKKGEAIKNIRGGQGAVNGI